MSLIWWQKVQKYLWQLFTTSSAEGNDRSQAERNKFEMDAVISYVEKKSFGFLQQPRHTTSRNCVREISLPFNDFLLRLSIAQICERNVSLTSLSYRLATARYHHFLKRLQGQNSANESKPTRVLLLWLCSSLSSFNFHCTISWLWFKQLFFHFRDANSPFSMVLITQTLIHG